MMAVGDDQLLIGHGLLDGLYVVRICNYPQAVNYSVFIGEFGNRSSGGLRFVENFFYALMRVGIQHKKLARVRASVAKQFEAIGLWTRESMFVAENEAGGIFLEPACANDTAAGARLGNAGPVGSRGGRRGMQVGCP